MYIHLTVCQQMSGVKLFLLHSTSWNQLAVSKNDWYLIELLLLDKNTWNHLTACQQFALACLKVLSTKYVLTNYILNMCM